MIGLIFIALLLPSGALAQGYKLFKNEDIIKKAGPDPRKSYREEILTDKDTANKELGGILVIVPPAAPGAKPRFHYHKKRESILIILSGEATELVEGKAVPIKAGDVIFLAPNSKHTIINNSSELPPSELGGFLTSSPHSVLKYWRDPQLEGGRPLKTPALSGCRSSHKQACGFSGMNL